MAPVEIYIAFFNLNARFNALIPLPPRNTKNSRSRAFVPTCCNSPLESKNIDKINASLWLKSSGESPLCPILLFRSCNFDEPDWPIQTCPDNKLLLERFRVTFTPNGKREFVPHDQVFPYLSFTVVSRQSFIHKNCSILRNSQLESDVCRLL